MAARAAPRRSLHRTARAVAVALFVLLLLFVPSPVSAGGDEPAPASAPHRVDGLPAPLVTNEQLDLTLTWQAGRFAVASAQRVHLPRAISLPRFGGRFVVRLYDLHHRLLDVLHFDFPLLADAYAPDGTPAQALATLGAGIATRTTVRLPCDSRVAVIEVHDGKGGAWLALVPPAASTVTAAGEAAASGPSTRPVAPSR